MDNPTGELRILMLEDVPSDAELEEIELSNAGLVYTSLRVDTREAFERALDEFKPDIVLADYRLPKYSGRDALEYTRRTHPHIPVIMVTGALGDEAAVELLKLGTRDYVLKDHLVRLAPAVKRALSEENSILNRELAEEKYHALFTEAMDGIVLIDCGTWQIADCNPEFEKQAGRTLEQLKELKVWEVLPPEQHELARQRLLKIQKTGSGRGGMFKMQKTGGEIISVEFSAKLIDIRQQSFIQSITRDITKRLRTERALRESEEKFRSITASAQDAILMLDNEGKISYWNEAAEKIFGYSSQEASGQSLHDLLAPGRFHEAFRHGFSHFRETGEGAFIGRTIELAALRKDGTEIPIELSLSAIKRDGQWNGIGIVRDITERKQAEARLRQERDFSDGIVETAQAIILVLSPQGRIVRFNRFMEVLTGYSLNEVEGQDWFSTFLPEPDREKTRRLFQGAIHDIQTRGNINAILTKDGRQLLIEWYDKTLRDEKGNVTGLIAIGLDVTERKRAEQIIQDEKAFSDTLIQSLPNIFYLIDRQGCLLRWSRKGEELLGLPPEKLLRADVLAFIHEEDRPLIIQKVKEAFETGSAEAEARMLMKSGVRNYILTAKRIETQSGVNLVGIGIDITERKRAEDALQRANRALQTLSSGNLALVRAASEDELLRMVTGIVVEKGGYSMAMVGYAADDPENSITPMAWSGMEESQCWAQHLSWADTELGQMPVAKAIRSGTMQICRDIVSDPGFNPWRDVVQARGYKANIALPLSDDNKTFGGLSIFSTEASAFDEEEVRLLEELANDLAYGIVTLRIAVERDRVTAENQQYQEKIRENLENAIQAIAATVEMRDPYTAGHEKRVSELAVAIGRELGLPDGQLDGLRIAGSVHDLGKVRVPAEILSKPGTLDEIEFRLVRIHPEMGYQILKGIDFPWPIATIVWQHHERLDGSGYPRGLKGSEILLEAQILSVADVIDAMMSHRPYRPALGLDAALKDIMDNRGKLYNADVVDACVKLFKEKGFVLP